MEEDCVGCPLPSTPEDENILASEMTDVLKAAVLGTGMLLDFGLNSVKYYRSVVFNLLFKTSLIRHT